MNLGYIFLCVQMISFVGIVSGKDSAELHLYPSYLQVELRGTVTIPVAWKQMSSATLTIAQDLSGTLTDVFKINGSEYEIMNFWNGKATVELSNGTEIRWANITLTNVALEDEGTYTIKVREENVNEETLYNTGHCRINTYALPIYINIASNDNLRVNEGTEVAFTCTGNVGRPPGTLELVQIFSAEYSPTVAKVSILELSDFSKEMLSNGTFRIQHEFVVNLSRVDNGTTFRCRNVHYIPGFNVVESQTSSIAYVNFTGLDFTLTRDRVLLGSTGTLTMNCDITEADVEKLYIIQIRMLKSPELSGSNDADWQTLTLMEISANETPTLDEDVVAESKDYVAGGSWDSTTPANTYLSLSMNMEKLVCSDARYYRCELSYKSSTSGSIVTAHKNATFLAFVNPQVTSLIARKNGFIVQGMSPSDMATAEVGDELELTCTANIGSLPGTLIRWHRTSETATNDDFIGYQPPQGTFTEGTATSDNQCGYTRVATIKYNATAADANRDNNLAFECYVTISGDPYGNSYTTENNPKFYTEVTDPDGGEIGSNVDSAGPSNVGAIVGGIIGGLVAIVLIVIIVWFLWFRRQQNGADYTTKEEYGSENPNMAPPVDTYATVDKSRKRGHENRGLDEPHENRRHNYVNSHGKSNYGMDRETDDFDDYDDDRDGSPNPHSINHMGMDSHGGIGTGV